MFAGFEEMVENYLVATVPSAYNLRIAAACLPVYRVWVRCKLEHMRMYGVVIVPPQVGFEG